MLFTNFKKKNTNLQRNKGKQQHKLSNFEVNNGKL